MNIFLSVDIKKCRVTLAYLKVLMCVIRKKASCLLFLF